MNDQGFYSFPNFISHVRESIYDEVVSYVKLLDGMSRLNNNNTYLVDFYKGEILYVSYMPWLLCEVPFVDRYESLGKVNKYVPKEETEMMTKIIRSWFSFLMNLPIEDRDKHPLQLDYHLNGKLLNLRMIPVFFSEEGRPWIILSDVRMSTNDSAGNAIILKSGGREYWRYSEKEEWIPFKRPALNDIELKVLCLSIQGKKEHEICEKIFRSKDGLKSIKRKIFRKMDVRNITEAASYALYHGLIK